MAIRLFSADRAFFLNDLEGPSPGKPLMRITRKGVGGQKIIADDPVSIVFYGATAQPVLTPGRLLTKREERAFDQGYATLLPAVPRKTLQLPGHFQPLAGRLNLTRDWASKRGR